MATTLENRIKIIQEILKVPTSGTFDFTTCKAYETYKKLNITSAEITDHKKEIQKSLGITDQNVDGDIGPKTLELIEKDLKITGESIPVDATKIKLKLKDTVTIQNLKDSIAALGYKWFEDQPNIIGVRATEQKADKFNDTLFMVYKKNDVEQLYAATITTDPGVISQTKPENVKGCWVMMPQQMPNAYQAGFHHWKPDRPPHRALRSVGKIYGFREDDRDGILFNDNEAVAAAAWANGADIWANIHGTRKEIPEAEIISNWSAGCQVHSNWARKEEMMNILDRYKNVNEGLFTYTLINEVDIKY